ncbi:TonB-dependent receptor [Gammaproteobacteria bacterium]|nr:TonB-dependent receptor [Gammaproteobacteria bacterium]
MKRLLSLLTIVSFVAIPNYSYAQNAELVLEEVVVTATKKEENVQDIAQTVNAVTGSSLDDYQIRDLSELAQVVSGVEFTKIDPRRATIIMRGQKLDPDGGNDQPIQGYIDEVPLRAGLVFNQMYDTERVEILKGSQGTLQGVVSTAGAIQIYTRSAEVGSGEKNGYVKTMWGDNMTSMVEAASDFHLSDTLSLRFAGLRNTTDGNEIRNIRTHVNESHSYESGRISLSWQPSDELSVRFKYQNMETDSIYPQPVAGSNGTPSYEQVVNGYVAGIALYESLGFAPAGSAAQLAYLHRPTYGDIPAGGLKPEDGVALHFHDPRQNNSGEIHNLMIDYDMGSHALALRFSKSENDSMGLIDRDYAGAYVYGYPQEVRTNAGIETFEMRISNQDSDKLEYTLGFFSRDSQTHTDADLDRSFSITEVAPQLYQPAVGFAYNTPNQACRDARANPGSLAAKSWVLTCMGIPLNNKTEAYFANFKYNLSDKTFVQFGFREQEIVGFKAQNLYLPLTALLPAALGGGLTIPRIPAEDQHSNVDSTTGSFKIGHYITEDMLLYVSTETGFRSPGLTISPVAINPSLLSFVEEESDMTEIGMKGTFMDGRLRLNAAYFDYTIDNFQSKWDNVSAREYTAAGAGNVTQVQGGIFTNNDAEVSGIDIEYAYVVSENLVLGGSYSSNDSEYAPGSIGYANNPAYTGYAAATQDVSGTPVSDAAESSLTFYLDHTVQAYWGGERYTRYNVSWRDERTSAINADITIKALYLANIIVGWRSSDDVWDASFFVKNITDDVDLSNIQGYYSDYALPGGSGLASKFYAGNTNMGRQMGAQLVYNF